MQDALRIVGLGLKASRVPQATLRIDAACIAVDARGPYGKQTFCWEARASQAHRLQAGRRSRRLMLASMDPWALTRWSVLLRGAGALLDLDGHGTCEMHAAVESAEPPRESQSRVYVDGQETLGVEALRENLLRLRLRREGASPPRGSATGHSTRPW